MEQLTMAILIKSNTKHHQATPYRKEHIQSANIVVEDWFGPITLAVVYCPPKHTIKEEHFNSFLTILGSRFIAGLNAKHVQWGSRLTLPRRRELLKAVETSSLKVISPGSPTY